MIVKFLGSGTSQGIPVIGCECETCKSTDTKDKRLRCSVYIEINDAKLLIDAGPDLRQQLLREKIENVDAILITHEHNDHTAGLDDIRPINFKHAKVIPLYSIARVLEDLKMRFRYIFSANPYPGSPRIELIEIFPYTTFKVGNIEILPIEYDHGSIKIIGYRIDNFAYLTDVSHIDEKAFQHLKNLDVLVISALQKVSHHAHFSVEEAINAAQKIYAKKTYLIHMSHTLGPYNEWAKELPTNVYASYDGLVLDC